MDSQISPLSRQPYQSGDTSSNDEHLSRLFDPSFHSNFLVTDSLDHQTMQSDHHYTIKFLFTSLTSSFINHTYDALIRNSWWVNKDIIDNNKIKADDSTISISIPFHSLEVHSSLSTYTAILSNVI